MFEHLVDRFFLHAIEERSVRHRIRNTFGLMAVVALGAVAASPSVAFAQLADLVVTAVTNPPSPALPGDSFVITATVKNQGTGGALASVTKFFFVPPTGPITPTTPRKNLDGGQNVASLGAGASASSGVTVEIFSDTVPGVYRLLACADGGQTIFEGAAGEANNCIVTTATIQVLDVPDLELSSIVNPTTSIGQGQPFTLTTTVKNVGAVPTPDVVQDGTQGGTAAKAEVKYELCVANGCVGPGRFDLKNKQPIPKLGAGGEFSNAHEVVVRPETPVGQYQLRGCINANFAEDSEQNNCKLAGFVNVTPMPDLNVKSVSVAGTPLTINAGDSLVLTTVVRNQGLLDAPASQIKFVFVNVNDPNVPTENLKDRPFTPPIPAGTKRQVVATVRTYDDTPSGVYRLRACADSENDVPEIDDRSSDNCTDAPHEMTVAVVGLVVTDSDLVVSALTNPPTVAFPGDTIEGVIATVQNLGTDAAPSTTTKFNLLKTNPTVRKNLKGVQIVPGIPANGTSAVPISLQVFEDTVPGSYFLEACADDLNQVLELDDDNNCRITTGQVVIQAVPNLAVTDLDDPPAELLQNQPFDVKDTVQNTGPVTAGETMVKYYLVSVLDQTRTDLKNKKPVPSLTAGQTYSATQTVRVKPETVPGTYHLEACADSGNVVPEPTEDDNCLTSLGTVVVKGLPDLVVNRVTVLNSPVTVARGASFTVESAVRNQGAGDAGSSFTRFYFVVTPGAAQKRALTGTQSVPPLPSLTKKQSTVSVNVEETTPVGTYYVLACADEVNKSVTEKDENNNCTTSLETVTVVQ
jgi:hypothetical protein